MKKTLAAVAVLGAFAGSALAADVTLYGRVDAGLNWTSVDYENGADSSKDYDNDSFSMKSGQYTGSRWGLKGSEQISENLTVGFQLENGFSIDDGKLGQGSRLFGREARVYAQTQFGEFGFGRMGGLDSGLGSYDMISGASVFGTGWGDYTGNMLAVFLGKSDRYDNMISYKSPTFAGLTVVAQASLSKNSADDFDAEDDLWGEEGKHSVDRYYALGVSAKYGAFSGALTYSLQDYHNVRENDWGVSDKAYNDDDGQTITAWGAYDFGVTKVSLGAQYFDAVQQSRQSWILDADKSTADNEVYKATKATAGYTGYGVILGAVTPLAGGNLYTSVGYADYEESEVLAKNDGTTTAGAKEDEFEAWSVSVGYDYPLSKRTKVYAAASYSQLTENGGEHGAKDDDTKVTEVMAGMVHYF